MSAPEHVIDLLGAYALDALDELEAARVRAHLAGCASCRAQFAGLSEAAGRLADVLPPEAPPPELRGQVLAAVRKAAREAPATAQTPARARAPAEVLDTPRAASRLSRSAWVRGAQALAGLALVATQVWLIATIISLRSQLQQQAEVQTVLLSSNEIPVSLQPPDPASPARGMYHYEPDLRRGVISYYRLAPPGPSQFYQCWMEYSDRPAQPCGRLPLDNDGSGVLLFTWTDTAPTWISVTRETGSPTTPHGPIILLGAVQPLQP